MQVSEAIEGFLMDWELREHSPNTLRLYRSCLTVFARWLEEQGITEVEDVTVAHLRAFMLHTQQRPADAVNPKKRPDADGRRLSTASLQSYVKSIKVLFRWLVEEEVLVRNPALRLQKPTGPKRVKVTFSHAHLNALFGACDLSHPLGFRDYVLMLVLLDTGIRVAELCSLTLESMHEGYLKVFGKGRKEREVGISPTTAKFLWKYIHQYRLAADDAVTALFTNFAGSPLRPSGVEKLIQRVREAAGITDVPVTPHKFRHTFARTWLERGGELYSLSRLMGHSSVKVTEIYLEDFQSRQARLHHTKYSPVGELKLRTAGTTAGSKMGTARHTYKHYPRWATEDDGEEGEQS
jgi:site-specific recombinase XerD